MSEAPGSNNSGLLHRVIKITPRVILYVRPALLSRGVRRGRRVIPAVIEGPLGAVGTRSRERVRERDRRDSCFPEIGPDTERLATVTRFDAYFRVAAEVFIEIRIKRLYFEIPCSSRRMEMRDIFSIDIPVSSLSINEKQSVYIRFKRERSN